MNSPSADEQLASLLDELIAQSRGGRQPDLEAVVREHPALADELRALWATAMIADDLAEDLRETRETIARHERNLAKYESNEKAIIERFDSDIERFKILKGIQEPPKTASAGS